MKLTSFALDKRLYELLQDEGITKFTTVTLRDLYASRLQAGSYKLSDVRRYVYEHIRRMLRVGWLVRDAERRKRGQVYHLRPMPKCLKLKLIEKGFENSFRPDQSTQQVSSKLEKKSAACEIEVGVYQRLEETLREVRLDFLASMGETERYKQLLDEMPDLLSLVEHDYQESRDRSSRLLGHIRAVEKTLTTLPT